DSHFIFEDGCEFTVEANPNSISAEHLALWRDWRVSRVSLGVQSFDDAELEMMGRLHSGMQAYGAMSAAMASGFSVSVDLMFGLPYQTFQGWYRNLKDAARSGVHHISLYQLSIERGTPWENLKQENLSDGYWPYRWAQWYFPKKGFIQYEISNFAKPGHESKHNLNYWNEGEYLGVGPGASGCLAGWR
ncbi:MAG: coproporphyrinogen dehydrogenase, partial [Synergistaceae bacterium]